MAFQYGSKTNYLNSYIDFFQPYSYSTYGGYAFRIIQYNGNINNTADGDTWLTKSAPGALLIKCEQASSTLQLECTNTSGSKIALRVGSTNNVEITNTTTTVYNNLTFSSSGSLTLPYWSYYIKRQYTGQSGFETQTSNLDTLVSPITSNFFSTNLYYKVIKFGITGWSTATYSNNFCNIDGSNYRLNFTTSGTYIINATFNYRNSSHDGNILVSVAKNYYFIPTTDNNITDGTNIFSNDGYIRYISYNTSCVNSTLYPSPNVNPEVYNTMTNISLANHYFQIIVNTQPLSLTSGDTITFYYATDSNYTSYLNSYYFYIQRIA